jgi:ABC-type glutathione transport system ATPase component
LTTDSSTPASAHDVGLGHVLDHVRQPDELRTPHVVEFRDVSKTYNFGKANAFTAIKDLNFVVEDLPDQGELVAILGPSGCGKSTILRLIAGLEPQHPATVGDVLVQGQGVVGPRAHRSQVLQKKNTKQPTHRHEKLNNWQE